MIFNSIEVAPVLMYGQPTKYVVTKDGRVFNTQTGHQLKWKVDTKGYYVVTLSENGNHQDKRVHVLVALGFVKNPDPDKFNIVNHLDGDKKNPYYTNLEWTDHSGNMRHAADHGLLNIKREEESGRAVLTNYMVHEICKLMEEGNLSQREIAKHFNIEEYLVREIKNGNNWKTISSKYKIENCKLDIKKNLTVEIVHSICSEFVKNELSVKDIALKYEVPYDSVLGVLRHGYYSYISKDYDFSHYDKTKPPYPKELKDKVVKMILDGKTNQEILNELGIESSGKIAVMLYRERRKIDLCDMK